MSGFWHHDDLTSAVKAKKIPAKADHNVSAAKRTLLMSDLGNSSTRASASGKIGGFGESWVRMLC